MKRFEAGKQSNSTPENFGIRISWKILENFEISIMTMMKAMRWRQWLDYPSGVGLGVVNRLNPLHYCNLTSFSFSGGFCSSFSV